MDYDKDKVDEAVMALLFLTMFSDHSGTRAWKGHDWDALNRLHEKGWIDDPKNKAKSAIVTPEGAEKAKELFAKLFAKGGGASAS